jgi:hypothetical protein
MAIRHRRRSSAASRYIADVFKDCNAEAFASYSGDRAIRYAKLKLAAIKQVVL